MGLVLSAEDDTVNSEAEALSQLKVMLNGVSVSVGDYEVI